MQTASFQSSLPALLTQVLGGLDALPDGLQGLAAGEGGGFWMRLTAYLQDLEALSGVFPEDMDADALTAWLAANLGGEPLPQDGSRLPLPVDGSVPGMTEAGPIDPEDGFAPLALLREQLLAAVHVAGRDVAQAAGRIAPGLDAQPHALAELAAAGARQAESPATHPAAVIAAHTADTGSIARDGAAVAGGAVPLRTFDLEVPLHQPGWDRALGDRVRWMSQQNVQVAELRLNPPNLGPLEVRVQMEGDRTHISFVTSQAVVRDAIDAALPRLREMFAEGGMSLGDVTVSHQDARHAGGGEGERGWDHGAQTEDADAGVTSGHEAPRQGLGLVDYYA